MRTATRLTGSGTTRHTVRHGGRHTLSSSHDKNSPRTAVADRRRGCYPQPHLKITKRLSWKKQMVAIQRQAARHVSDLALWTTFSRFRLPHFPLATHVFAHVTRGTLHPDETQRFQTSDRCHMREGATQSEQLERGGGDGWGKLGAQYAMVRRPASRA